MRLQSTYIEQSSLEWNVSKEDLGDTLNFSTRILGFERIYSISYPFIELLKGCCCHGHGQLVNFEDKSRNELTIFFFQEVD